MAFKRNYGRGKRPAGWQRRGARFARQRRTWVQSQLFDPCNPQTVPLCTLGEEECCTTRFNLVILDNGLLQSKFSDQATVSRILGNVLIGWDTTSAAANEDEIYARLAASSGDMYVQLIKRSIDRIGNVQLPPEIWDNLSVIDGFSESKAIHTWWHHWNSYDQFKIIPGATQSAFASPNPLSGLKHRFVDGVTSATSGLAGTLTGGTGTIGAVAIPAPGTVATVAVDALGLDADCVECGSIDFGANPVVFNSASLGTPRAWRFRINNKRRIKLREDEQLVLDFQFRQVYRKAGFADGGELLLLSGGIKSLITF